MLHEKSESDVTSLAPSSPRSPNPPPPSILRAEPITRWRQIVLHANNSRLQQPRGVPFPLFLRSALSVVVCQPGFRWKVRSKKNNDKGWPQAQGDDVIDEEGDCYHGNNEFSRRWRCQVLIWVSGSVVFFFAVCFVIWAASRPFKPQITVKSFSLHNLYYGEGSDLTGVPTKMLTVNCSVKINVHNPATFFGIHVSSRPVNLMYSQLTVATGELKKYFQTRRSQRTVHVNLKGTKVALYGAGASFAVSDKDGGIPVTLVFEVRSRGYVVGKLVKSRHGRQVACCLEIDSRGNKAIKFNDNSCTYN